MEEFDIEDPEESVGKTKCFICLIGCRRVTTFLLSHVGLISLVIAYCLLGAVTFEYLEKEHELMVKRNMTNVREEVSEYLWKMTQEMPVIYPPDWLANATARLQVFETELINLMKKGGWDGNESLETQQWTFAGALFYSIVVITTIGFGHITPKTDWGKVVTIFYAVLGIPLMLLCLSHIGDFMATAFRVLYWKVCCYVCYRQPRRRRHAIMSPPRSLNDSSARIRSSPRRSFRRSVENRASHRSEDSAMSDSGILTLADRLPRRVRSQEDFRNAVPLQQLGTRRSVRTYRSQQIVPVDKPKSHSAKAKHPYAQRFPQSEDTSPRAPDSHSFHQLPVLCNKYADDSSDLEMKENPYDKLDRLETFERPVRRVYSWEDDDYYNVEIQKRPVPIWLCVFLVFSYILGGAALFSKWEEWPFLDSAYFCFITLTTIGFGDFVPAQKVKTDVEVSIALCSLYLLFGISLLAMSFNLVQEELIHSVKQIGYGLGIIREGDQR